MQFPIVTRRLRSRSSAASRPRTGPRIGWSLAIALALIPGLVSAASAAPRGRLLVASAAVPACQAAQLSAQVVRWTGTLGGWIADIEIANTSFTRCSLRDLPRVELLSAQDVVMIEGPAASTTAHTHGLGPLATLRTLAADSNFCGPAYVSPVTLAFVLPGTAGRVVAIPAPTAGGVPPCNGAPGSAGHISMHPWHV